MISFFQKQRLVSASGLGLFRIAFFLVQFFEVFQIFSYKELVFDTTPFLEPDFVPHTYFFIAWLVTLVFIIVGYKTRTALIVNYALNLVYFSVSGDFEYHMDYVYTGVNFLSLFLPLSLSYSIDALKTDMEEVPKVSFLNHLVLLFACIALVYTDSIFHKAISPMWMNGLGMWLPSSLPSFTWLDLQWILNQEFLVKFMGYLTLVFELVFIALMWFRVCRPLLALIGIGLHFGIFLAFPIPFFGFCYCAIYFLMLFFEEFYDKFDSYFLALKDILKIKGSAAVETLFKGHSEKFLYSVVVIMGLLQLNGIALSPSAQKVLPREVVRGAAQFRNNVLRPFLGSTRHGVFMDWHFQTAKYITIIKHNNDVLPFFKESGQVADYPYGRFWVNANFRFLSVQSKDYKEGLRRYTADWAVKNKKDLRHLDLDVYVKATDVPKKWEKDFLTKQMAKPLVKIGTIKWRNYKFEFVKGEK